MRRNPGLLLLLWRWLLHEAHGPTPTLVYHITGSLIVFSAWNFDEIDISLGRLIRNFLKSYSAETVRDQRKFLILPFIAWNPMQRQHCS